jgi:hypothetical protein
MLVLLLCVGARAEEEKVDLVARARAGDVCDREIQTKLKLRGTIEAGRATRAVTVSVSENNAYRDTFRTADSLERHYRRLKRVSEARIAGVKPSRKDARDPLEGQKRTLDAFSADGSLVSYLEPLFDRKGVEVGDRWEWTDLGRVGVESGELKCKLSEVTPYKKQRVAKVYVTFKMKGMLRMGKVDASARGYVWFSLDAGRIVRTRLKGPIKMVLDEIGTVHGTIQEDSTTEIVKRGEEKARSG